MTKSAEELAEEFRVPPNALPPRNRKEHDIMLALMRGRRQGFIAGYTEGEKHGRESMLLEVQQLISARIASWRAAGWDKVVCRELGEAMKIDELIDSLYEKEGKDE